MVSPKLLAAGLAVSLSAVSLGQSGPGGRDPGSGPPLGPVSVGAEKPSAGPLDNTILDAARVLIPDGTSYSDTTANGWFIARLEADKSYVVEAMASDNDGNNNFVDLSLFESDGTTPWGSANFQNCGVTMDQRAPALQATESFDGSRCAVGPELNNAVSTRPLAFRVTGRTPYHLRVRETTVYSRWTTNSYNMFIPLHNTGGFAMSGFVLYYPESGPTDVGAQGYVTFDNFSLGARSSTQFVHNNGTLSPNRGQLRVLLLGGLNSGGTHDHMQAYAFNLAVGNYLFFAPEHVNDGRGNSW
jgi:hypothetical protein